MNTPRAEMDRARTRQTLLMAAAAAAVYCIYYFILCKMPVIGTPTFRIDYFATTVTRAGNSLSATLMHARPVSELYVHVQAILAKYLLHGQTKFIIYPFQHVVVLIYFLSISKVVESLFETRLHPVTFLTAWLLFMVNPGVISNVYLLETIVGTLSMLFGGLALVALEKWARDRKGSSAALFVALLALSLFAKEDFILPPILLLGWHLAKDGHWKAQLRRHKWLLTALLALFVAFMLFNEVVLPGRSYMDPVEQTQSPYYMSINPVSMLKTTFYYTMEVGRHIRILTLFYLAISTTAILLRRKVGETILIGLIVAGLMAPYLIMPNHLFAYYGLNWWVWQSLASLALIQLVFVNRYVLVTAVAAVAILLPGLNSLRHHRSINWNQSLYLRTKFAISDNLQKTLLDHRKELNASTRVAVIGIGPGQIDQSPWQGNGETAFYLSGDLGIKTQWVVFVNSNDDSYVADTTGATAPKPPSSVLVENISRLGEFDGLPRLVFNPDGTGDFVTPRDIARQASRGLSVPGSVFSMLPIQRSRIRRRIHAADNYVYMRGFNQSEGANGRWLSSDNHILLAPAAGDRFELTAYVVPLHLYLHHRLPRVIVSFNGCATPITREGAAGSTTTLIFPIPDNCHITPGEPVDVRIRVDNLLDATKSHDSRALGVLGKEIGFAGPLPDNRARSTR